MARWNLSCPLGILSRRILKRLPEVAKLVAPRVQTAVLKTLWNKWTTAARFQNQAACVLNCSKAVDALGQPLAQDKIEHYLICPFTKHLLNVRFGLHAESASKNHLLFAADGLMEHPDKVTLLAVTCYVVMRATNNFRKQPPSSAEVVFDFLEEASKAAVAGHQASQSVLQHSRASTYRHGRK